MFVADASATPSAGTDVDLHCVQLITPVAASTAPENESGPEDPVWVATDSVPAGEEICVNDENLAWQIADVWGRRIGKLWTNTNWTGNSKVFVAPDPVDFNGDGCLDNQSFSKASFGATFNNNVESWRGYAGCDMLKIYDYKNFKGTLWTSLGDASSLVSANNKNGSVVFAP